MGIKSLIPGSVSLFPKPTFLHVHAGGEQWSRLIREHAVRGAHRGVCHFFKVLWNKMALGLSQVKGNAVGRV